MAIGENDPLLQGLVVQRSIGMPEPMWTEIDRQVGKLGKKSRAALITEIVLEELKRLRAAEERLKK